MRTILIPVDAADSCNNTLRYVAGLTHDKPVERIILLRSFYVSLYAQLLPSADFVQLSAEDIQQERQTIQTRLVNMAQKLQEKAAPGVKVEPMIAEGSLLRSVHEMIENEKPDLVIISSRCKLTTNDDYNGDFVIQIAKSSPAPVLIVPTDIEYQPIRRALVPCDFSSLTSLKLLNALPPVQPIFHPDLLVLNIDTGKPMALNPQEVEEELQRILQRYQYELHYRQDRNILHGIMDFALNHPVQMIVALPGRHSFFYNLTHSSITKALALNARQPVLILK